MPITGTLCPLAAIGHAAAPPRRPTKTGWATCETGGKVYRVDLEWKDADSIIDFVADIAKEVSLERRLAYIDGEDRTLHCR